MEKSQATRVGVLAALAIALLLAGSYFMSGTEGPATLLVTFPSGSQIKVEVADNPLMLHAGLAFRDSLPAGWGMLFIYDAPDFHKISTKEYRFPVDLLWLNEGKQIILISENVPPCAGETCPQYGPAPQKDRYVIATPAGFVRQQNIQLGSDLKFTLQL
jgi:uncharacterized membrane protein (UPF0127 family)